MKKKTLVILLVIAVVIAAGAITYAIPTVNAWVNGIIANIFPPAV